MGNSHTKFLSSIDMVQTAQAEYDFLYLVDKYPALYFENVLRNAVYRYENYWLPLVAKYDLVVVAPLDIEWVWHAHVLNPVAYNEDCRNIVGKVIDRVPMFLALHTQNVSQKYWCNEYPNIPYEIDLFNSKPVLLSSEPFKCSYNIVAAAQRQRIFSYNVLLPHFRDAKFLSNAVKRYKIMITIKKNNPETYLVPCYDFGLIWHSHQQHGLLYQSKMSLIYGTFLFHDDSSLDFHLYKDEKEKTIYLWKKQSLKQYKVNGGMYRGEPLLPNLDDDIGFFSRSITNIWVSSCNILALSFSDIPTFNSYIHDVVVLNVVAKKNGCVIYEYSKCYSTTDGTINVVFCRGENAFQLDSNFSYEVFIYCTYPSINKVFSGIIIPRNTLTKHAHQDIFLKCPPNESLTCTIVTSMDNYLLKSKALFKTGGTYFVRKSKLGEAVKTLKLCLPTHDFYSGVFCEYCENELHPIGENLIKLKWKVVHSREPPLAVIELYDYSGYVIATSHTVNWFHLPSSKQLSESTKCFTYNPSFERAMLISGLKGDWALIKSNMFYDDTLRRKNLVMQLFILNENEPRLRIVESFNLVFKCSVANGTISVNIWSNEITLSEGLTDIPECLCIALSISVLCVLSHVNSNEIEKLHCLRNTRNMLRCAEIMGRAKHCGAEKRQLIIKLKQEGKTYKFIQETLSCSLMTIRNALKWKNVGETRGRKQKTTEHEDRLIKRAAVADPFLTSRHIKEDLNLGVSSRTVRRRLVQSKLVAISPRKVPFLKKRHVVARLHFAQTHADCPVSKWHNILWSDESKIVLFGSSGRRIYVRRPPNSAYKPQYTIKTITHGGAKLNVWGCFTYYGVGPIFKIDGLYL
ncbi:uncharacterized protein LOC136091442 isoform X2 [Hydra vulgaris]|uniref:Uncharacterized protein LOC136091442 isoform X2 n=1 Tax=Hydra vulgaris TaxID=6087 RepID=A0ABM4DKP4_HYDVU